EALAERIRTLVENQPGVTEKKMFGGVAFLVDGKMFVGIVKDDLMVRVGPDHHEESLKQPHVRPMDFSGRPMVGYVYVAPEGLSEDEDLGRWVRLASKFVATLPEKKRRPKARKAKTPRRKGSPSRSS